MSECNKLNPQQDGYRRLNKLRWLRATCQAHTKGAKQSFMSEGNKPSSQKAVQSLCLAHRKRAEQTMSWATCQAHQKMNEVYAWSNLSSSQTESRTKLYVLGQHVKLTESYKSLCLSNLRSSLKESWTKLNAQVEHVKLTGRELNKIYVWWLNVKLRKRELNKI